MVKMRESFRPFAPAVSLEEVDRWFDVPPGTQPALYDHDRGCSRRICDLITRYHSREPDRKSADRMPNDDPVFHALLQAVGRETGREIVLNTSFNVKGQPIVNTPQEAVSTFLSTGIDFLFMEDFFVCA